jgi:hypothetical protein
VETPDPKAHDAADGMQYTAYGEYTASPGALAYGISNIVHTKLQIYEGTDTTEDSIGGSFTVRLL